MDKIGRQTLDIMKKVTWYNKWLYSFVKPHLKGKILEVGAGIGNFTELLKGDGELYSIDVDHSYIKLLRKKFNSTVKIGFGDIEKAKFFFKGEKFDSIVIMNVLEHIKDDQRTLKNMFDLLRKGGKLIVLVPAFDFSYGSLDSNLSHYRRYTKRAILKKLTSAGFKQTNIRYLNSLGIIGWFFNARLTRKKVIPEKQLLLFNLLARPILEMEKYIKVPFGLSVFSVSEKA